MNSCVGICVKDNKVAVFVRPACFEGSYTVEVDEKNLVKLYNSHPVQGFTGNNANFKVRKDEESGKTYIDINFGHGLTEAKDNQSWVRLVVSAQDLCLAKNICNQHKDQAAELAKKATKVEEDEASEVLSK